MYKQVYTATVRSEWSEFSLRTKPKKIQPFQAGTDDHEKTTGVDNKGLSRLPYQLRNANVGEDSIESDAYAILMSYPEGQQRLLEKMEADKRKDKNNKVQRKLADSALRSRSSKDIKMNHSRSLHYEEQNNSGSRSSQCEELNELSSRSSQGGQLKHLGSRSSEDNGQKFSRSRLWHHNRRDSTEFTRSLQGHRSTGTSRRKVKLQDLLAMYKPAVKRRSKKAEEILDSDSNSDCSESDNFIESESLSTVTDVGTDTLVSGDSDDDIETLPSELECNGSSLTRKEGVGGLSELSTELECSGSSLTRREGDGGLSELDSSGTMKEASRWEVNYKQWLNSYFEKSRTIHTNIMKGVKYSCSNELEADEASEENRKRDKITDNYTEGEKWSLNSVIGKMQQNGHLLERKLDIENFEYEMVTGTIDNSKEKGKRHCDKTKIDEVNGTNKMGKGENMMEGENIMEKCENTVGEENIMEKGGNTMGIDDNIMEKCENKMGKDENIMESENFMEKGGNTVGKDDNIIEKGGNTMGKDENMEKGEHIMEKGGNTVGKNENMGEGEDIMEKDGNILQKGRNIGEKTGNTMEQYDKEDVREEWLVEPQSGDGSQEHVDSVGNRNLVSLSDWEHELFGNFDQTFMELLTDSPDVDSNCEDGDGCTQNTVPKTDTENITATLYNDITGEGNDGANTECDDNLSLASNGSRNMDIESHMVNDDGQENVRDESNMMRQSQVELFTSDFTQKCSVKMSGLLENAVVEALQECADRAGIDVGDYNSVKRWGIQDTRFTDLIQAAADVDVDLFAPDPGMELPGLVVEELTKLREENSGNISETDEEDLESELCVACSKHCRQFLCDHPLFEGRICCKCKELLLEGLFAYDSDGFNLFCAVCGHAGEMFVCEEQNCGRSFCIKCLKRNLDAEDFQRICGETPWLCLLCSMYSEESHGGLIPRTDWHRALVHFFNPVLQPKYRETVGLDNTGTGLRVLSLCDGIGTVRLALEGLGIKIDSYYTCETDPDAQSVLQFYDGSPIIALGDMYNIDREVLQEICPIDMVVCNPPSHDFDVSSNSAPVAGFNGPGMLIIKFLVILKDLKLLQGHDRPLYWLLETSTAIKSEFRKQISNFCEVLPCMWDTGWMSPYHLPRLFWGNLPQLYSPVSYYDTHRDDDIMIDTCLVAKLNRTSQVSKLRKSAINFKETNANPDDSDVEVERGDQDVTAVVRNNINSSEHQFVLPVLMNGQPSHIWTLEVERALGLPDHYTDVSRVNIQTRQKLLKQASSVILLKHLFSPLTSIST